jgi:hypothetical protein
LGILDLDLREGAKKFALAPGADDLAWTVNNG